MFNVFKPFDCFRPFAAPRRGSLPSVASLFADGEQGGLWLFDAAYQDSAGTTAADAQDDPVGLVLDQRYGAPEPRRNLLNWSNCGLTNWVLINATGLEQSIDWYGGPGVEVASTGAAWNTIVNNNVVANAEGKTFTITFFYQAGTSSRVRLQIRNTENNKNTIANGPVSVLSVLESGAGAAEVLSISVSDDGVIATVIGFSSAYADFSVRIGPDSSTPGETVIALGVQIELGTTPTEYQKIESGIGGEWTPGTHAVQTTTASKPILNYTTTTNKPWLSADSDDSLPVTFSESLGSNCTIARLGADGVTWQESQTVGTTFDLVQESQYNGGAFLIDRALSVAEKRAVERALKKYEPQAGEWP